MGLLPVAHGVPSYVGLAMNLLRVRPRPVPAFAAGKDACGRAWGQGCPCKTGRKSVAVGAGFFLGIKLNGRAHNEG